MIKPLTISCEQYERQFALGHTRYSFDEVETVIAEWNSVLAEYNTILVKTSQLPKHWEVYTEYHPLLAALADDIGTLQGSSKEPYPVPTWRRKVKKARAITARLRKAMAVVRVAA